MTGFHSKRMLNGKGRFQGPDPNAQFKRVVELIHGCLPLFAESVLRDGIENENGLNRSLSLFVTSVSRQKDLPFFAQVESMEDETRGDSPAADIGIHLLVDDVAIKPPKVTVFEGKRLTSRLDKKRWREYVVGHEDKGKHVNCGGIERFKLAIHGRDFRRAGMIGYVQDESPSVWHERVNGWISSLALMELDPVWTDNERLIPQKVGERVNTYYSIAQRNDGEIHLTHLWIDLSMRK